jgi:hypothetical protein
MKELETDADDILGTDDLMVDGGGGRLAIASVSSLESGGVRVCRATRC